MLLRWNILEVQEYLEFRERPKKRGKLRRSWEKNHRQFIFRELIEDHDDAITLGLKNIFCIYF